MSSFPLPTIACTTSPTGITGPGFSDILSSLQASVEATIGSDIYIDPDSQDGTFIAIYARAQADSNSATIAAVAQYNPQTAVGTGLDGAVKVNGIRRSSASNSSATVTIGGTAGTQIFGGQAQDTASNLWNLEDVVTIPPSGTIDVTATAVQNGNITAAIGAINKIFTVTLGWQTVTNAEPALPGSPVEVDGALRERQVTATAINSETTLAAIDANVANVPGVARVLVYENDGTLFPVTDPNGIPAGMIAVVAQGGNIADVALAIQIKKDVGCGTFGTTTVDVTDSTGLVIPIKFSELVLVEYFAAINITPLTGFTTATGNNIVNALVAFISALGIGETAYKNWAEAVAGLSGVQQQTFVITSFTQGLAANPTTTADMTCLFNQAFTSSAGNIILNVIP